MNRNVVAFIRGTGLGFLFCSDLFGHAARSAAQSYLPEDGMRHDAQVIAQRGQGIWNGMINSQAGRG